MRTHERNKKITMEIEWSLEDAAFIGYCPQFFPYGAVCHAHTEAKAVAKLERAELRDGLDAQDIEESPAFLAAVDEGIRSAENEPKNSLEDVMKRLQDRFGWKSN